MGPLVSFPSSRLPATPQAPETWGAPGSTADAPASAGGSMAMGSADAPMVGPAGPSIYEDAWQPTGFGGWYLAPKKLRSDYFDVVFHFHAGKAAAKEYREQGRGAVVVALTYGCGSKAYADAFVDPAHFRRMLDDMETRLRVSRNNPRLQVRRISLFAWSAGYGAIRHILTQGYYDRIDTVVLLDGLHANYLAAALPPARKVDGKQLDAFMRFAQDAMDGKKQFVFTHSSIVPPGYASTTETAAALIDVVRAQKVWLRTPAPRNLMRLYRADVGGFHIRGFSGTTKEAHIAQLHLVGEVLRELVVPRWVRLDRRLPAPKRTPVWQRADKAKRSIAGN
ncbi:hypothetical protein [Pendulispora albinea]|uniref:Uncharacterized protein n=1 Tax=Pendulispora albinea TaxID=2741071 RepID=A0ABZ2LU22_9BACT